MVNPKLCSTPSSGQKTAKMNLPVDDTPVPSAALSLAPILWLSLALSGEWMAHFSELSEEGSPAVQLEEELAGLRAEQEARRRLREPAEPEGFRMHAWAWTEEALRAPAGTSLHLALQDVQLVIGTMFYRSGRAPSITPGATLPTFQEFEVIRQDTIAANAQYDHAIFWVEQYIPEDEMTQHKQIGLQALRAARTGGSRSATGNTANTIYQLARDAIIAALTPTAAVPQDRRPGTPARAAFDRYARAQVQTWRRTWPRHHGHVPELTEDVTDVIVVKHAKANYEATVITTAIQRNVPAGFTTGRCTGLWARMDDKEPGRPPTA
ncbi:hypothetical protein HKX48_006568 [Thoreauomyces humboldtii]|nr:hypothetical protein HKX48_006568 [Thoreauomyces humboldtii]